MSLDLKYFRNHMPRILLTQQKLCGISSKMSIKSQKSLNEEISEIIERSYSVRSASEESLSCEDEDESLALELMNKLTPALLSKLRRCFKRSKEREQARDIDRRVEEVMRLAAAEEGIEFATKSAGPHDPLWLDENGFVAALDAIFGHHKYTTHAHKLFRLLDPFSTGKVRWRQLVCRLVAVGARKTRSRADVWAPVKEPGIRRLEHCKREVIVKLVSIEKEDSFCYVAVSKGGRVGIYSGHLKIVQSYEVFYHRTGMQKRVKNCWITDAVYLNDVQCLIYSASDRSLTVYDAATLTHTPTYCITGLPNIPTSMAYCPSFDGTSELTLGTERGDMIRVRFLQPRISLFYTKSAEHINFYFWMELSSSPHSSYCSITIWRRVHSRSVRRVFRARRNAIISCAHDANASVRARHAYGKLPDYVFRVQRGVTCFHVVPSLHLLATGSADGVVRLWELTQDTPFASLAPPTIAAAVLDVAVVAAKEIVIAYCNNCWLHIWDIYEECLLQTIKIRFPFLGVLGKRVEFGAYCIHPGPARKLPSKDELPEDRVASSLGVTSRRGSSVMQGSTGGLILQDDDEKDEELMELESEREHVRFNRPELLITCCDHVCTVVLSEEPDEGSILPPPGDTLRARRPSFWDLPDDVFVRQSSPSTSPTSEAPSASEPSPATQLVPVLTKPQFLSPTSAERPLQDLDSLLEKADLQGILEKDFVLMYGLKHDLNRKLAALEANKDAMMSAVSMGAPYLALRISELLPVEPADEMMDKYKQVMQLFPGPSVAATPTESNTTTPRKRGSQLL